MLIRLDFLTQSLIRVINSSFLLEIMEDAMPPMNGCVYQGGIGVEKKRFFANHSKSSALVVSLIFHGVLIVVALFIVAVKVIKPKEDPGFKDREVKREQVPPPPQRIPKEISKTTSSSPKLPEPIPLATKDNYVEIAMPDVETKGINLAAMSTDDVTDLMPNIQTIWGDSIADPKGKELTGTFYDLKQTDQGESTDMNINRFFAALANFVNGWNPGRLDDYFKAPRQNYATFFMIPTLSSSKATEAFGVGNVVTPDYWAAYYAGYISAPETGYYRFHGYGDDVLLVRINKRLVLDGGFSDYRPQLQTGWTSDDENNRKYPIGNQLLYIGDWFKLTKGERVKMEVLIGDVGGLCSSQLLIEQKGKTYAQVPFKDGSRPVLPVFKTKAIPKILIDQIKVNPAEATLDGPTFGIRE